MANGIDDLFKAINMFNDGLKSLQMGRVLNNANQAVESIRQSDLDAKQKRAELSNIANQLTFKLVGLGGSVGAAKELADTVQGPEQKQPFFQNADQAILYGMQTGDENATKAGLKLREIESNERIAAAKAQEETWIRRQDFLETNRDINRTQREGRADQDQVFKVLNDFRDKTAKKNIEALDALTGIEGIMNIPPEERGQAALGILQRAVVKQTGDPRISDQDADAIAPDPSIASKLKRNFRLLTQGKPLEKDFEEYGLMADMLKKANIRNLEQKAQGYVKSRKDYVRGVDANTLLEDIYSEYNLDKSNINTTNSPINQPSQEQMQQMYNQNKPKRRGIYFQE